MKRIYRFVFLSLAFVASCKKGNDSPVDKLPSATMTGADTFGCLINGEAWLPHTGAFWDPALNAYYAQWPTGEWQLFISARKIIPNKGIHQEFGITVWEPKLGENTIPPIEGIFLDFEKRGGNRLYSLDTLSPHLMTITKLDLANFIASGTFTFTAINDDCTDTIRVTDGRFDIDTQL
jgi:hypothetical protein